ncbi:hypothetical protein ABI_28800 [Asticcacaulis biprosthecium C19]|uniref:Uncharacterized protein n=1 Tax=Asticcacaulis biprosthecium C19 TaxID=715226 RepID=F4QMM2_9CAUL|nr:hypothetical protein ABI_28800 [Asticcacaulis biprosthecium C19]
MATGKIDPIDTPMICVFGSLPAKKRATWGMAAGSAMASSWAISSAAVMGQISCQHSRSVGAGLNSRLTINFQNTR